jgi:hypothetical protein
MKLSNHVAVRHGGGKNDSDDMETWKNDSDDTPKQRIRGLAKGALGSGEISCFWSDSTLRVDNTTVSHTPELPPPQAMGIRLTTGKVNNHVPID